MPYTIGSVLAKDANLINQSVATAQGDGTSGDPFISLHADLGIGAQDDAMATSPTVDNSVIALLKAVFSNALTIVASLGLKSDLIASDPFSNWSIVALLKRIASLQIAEEPSDYRSIGTDKVGTVFTGPGALLSFEAFHLNGSTLYLLLFDSAGNNTIGAPMRSLPIESGKPLIISTAQWGSAQSSQGLSVSNGVVFAFSTTPTIYTAALNSTYVFTARYIS